MKEENLELPDDELKKSFVGDALSLYVKDILRYKALSMEENKELAYLYKNGDNEAKDKMIKGNLRLVLYAASNYNNKLNENQISDIIQEGNIGLIKAIEHYNPSIGAFSTYAMYWIKTGIYRYLYYNNDIIKLPPYIKEMIRKYNNESISNNENKCKKVSDEFSKLKQVIENIYNVYNVGSLNEKKWSINGEDLRFFYTERGDSVASTNEDYKDVEEDIDNNNILLIIKEILNNAEYFIFFNHFLSEKYSLGELSNVFGISRERIGQIERKALKHIRFIMNTKLRKAEILRKIREREGKKFNSLTIYPINPNNLITYLYVKDELNPIEKKILYMIYFAKYNYTKKGICSELGIKLEEFDSIYQELTKKIDEKLKDKEQYDKYKKNILLKNKYRDMLNKISSNDFDNQEEEKLTL